MSQLIEPPAVEPLTRAEGKLRAGLDWADGDPRDALMDALIKAARQKVEQDTGLALIRQTRRVLITVAAGGVVPLPAQTIPTVSITPEAGAPPPVLTATAWSFPYDTSGAYLVVAGWPDADALAAEAPLLLQAVALLVAHMATLGRDLATIDQPYVVPLGYEDAIAPFRLQWVI